MKKVQKYPRIKGRDLAAVSLMNKRKFRWDINISNSANNMAINTKAVAGRTIANKKHPTKNTQYFFFINPIVARVIVNKKSDSEYGI